MHFQEVALTLLAFSAAHRATLNGGVDVGYTVVPPTGPSRIMVSQDESEQGKWYVRVEHSHWAGRRTLVAPIHFPAVTDVEHFKLVLNRAWSFHRSHRRSPPGLSRFLEPPDKRPTQFNPLRRVS